MINKFFNWTAGSFFRTIGRILSYLVIGGLIAYLLSFVNIASVNASVVETKEVSSIIANGTTIFDINSGLNTYKMVATGNSTYLRYEVNLLSNSPLNDSYFLVTQVCSNYGWEGVTDSSNVINVNGRMTYVKTLYTNQNAGSCTVNGYSGTIVQNIYLFNSQASSSVSGSSHIMSATLTTWHGGYTTYNGYIQVLSATIQDYDSNLEQQIINNNNQSSIINQNGTIINQNQTIIDQNNQTNDKLDETNEQLGEMNDYIQDDTPASTDDIDMDSLGTVSGLLPAGPVDSLLNIPFTFLSVLTSSMGGVCVPMTGTFVFDSTLSIPCFDTFYDDVPDYLMNFINLIPSGFILIMYFKHLYKKVERAFSLQTTADDEWGVI